MSFLDDAAGRGWCAPADVVRLTRASASSIDAKTGQPSWSSRPRIEFESTVASQPGWPCGRQISVLPANLGFQAGTFVASGAVADSGTVAVEQIAIAPIRNRDQGTLSGVETYTGQLGTIVTRFGGIAFPLSSPHEVGLGNLEVVSGTGAYVGLSGHGVFQIVVDAPPTS